MRADHWRRRVIRGPAIIVAGVMVLAAAGGLLAWQLTYQPGTSRPTTLPQASCGEVTTNRFGASTTVSDQGAAALSCFSAAARACKTASIGVTAINVDVGSHYVFTLKPGGSPCRVTELSQDYSANFGGSTGPIVATSCQERVVTGLGVGLRCAGQDFLIPEKVSPPGPVVSTLPRATCGSAVTHRLAADTEVLSADHGALRCFSEAARACRSASIEVVVMGVDSGTDYLFIVERGGAGCPVEQLSQAYSANFGGWKAPINGTSCHRITVDRLGVMLGCAGQHLLIPATKTAPQAAS